MRNHIDINTILKHRRSTQSLIENVENSQDIINKMIVDCKTVFDNTLKDSGESSFSRNYTDLINKVSEAQIADRTFNYPLLALERSEYKDNEVYLKQYMEAVVPSLDTDSLTRLHDTIDQYSINDDLKAKLKEVVESNLISDRILNNHHNIINRCEDIENIITNAMRLDVHTAANQIKEYVDTYSIRPYQKLNLCLEEAFYILESNGIDYNKSDLIKAITESFLITGYNEDKSNYIKVLENNYCFTEEDTQAAIDMLSKEDGITGTIQSIIDEYMRIGNIPFIDLCINIGCCSINDLKLNIGTALDFLWRCINGGQITYEDMNEGIVSLFESMANKIANSSQLMTTEDLKDICTAIEKYIISARDRSKSDLYTSDNSKIESYLNAINVARDQFIKDCSYLYNRNNIDTIYQLNQEAGVVNTLQEFKKFRFNNLVRSAINLEKFVKDKSKGLFDKIKLKNPGKTKNQSKLKLKGIVFTTPSGASVLFGENVGIESYIGEDNKADITVCQFYYDEACELEIKDFCSDVCKEFNKTINDENMRSYYIFNPGIGEIHLKENVVINLTEEEKHLVDSTPDPAMNVYVEGLLQFGNFSNKVIDLENLSDQIIDQKAIITNEQFEMLVEALQYLNVSKEDLEAFVEFYTEYRYKTLISENAIDAFDEETSEISNIVESYESSDEFVPFVYQLEAANIICDILEAGIKKPDIKKAEIKKANAGKDDEEEDDEDYDDDEDNDDDNDDEEEDDNKEEDDKITPEEKKNIDDMFDPRSKENKGFGKLINGIRLALKGLRAKFGDLGSKEQEASKNLDAGVDHLLKSLHDALISDRREAIIKGSVIPSFSRCIKAGIAMLAGGGLSMVLVGNIIPAVIVALGAFAVSKRLTQKERILLLDEIETELDVVEKEINLAESKNQLKKYRALLKYKKDLQRQYQRIKYNHRIGKDLMPNSATGVYKPES